MLDFNPTNLLMIPVFLLSITIHEFAHAFSARLAGDTTAEDLGRLTLNPLAHIDIVGTIIMPIITLTTGIPTIGWAKPVPVNPANFKRPYWELIVSLAGPFSNIALAILAGIAAKILIVADKDIPFYLMSQAISGRSLTFVLFIIALFFISINTLLCLFNLIPIPPLDGSHILFYFARPGTALGHIYEFLYRYGFMLLLLLLFFIPYTSNLFYYFVRLLLRFIYSIFL